MLKALIKSQESIQELYTEGASQLKQWLRFYSTPQFFKADRLFKMSYLRHSPYYISQEQIQKVELPDKILTYGETPWKTLYDILLQLPIAQDDIFYELGFGTGRNLVFTHLFFNLNVVGYELIPEFYERASSIVKTLKIEDKVELYRENWFEADLSKGKIFYITSTCYGSDEFELMREKFKEIPDGAYIITLSQKLEVDYLEVLHMGSYLFSWGETLVFIHRKVS